METRTEQSGESHDARGHDSGHQHGPGCGHTSTQHDDHSDYIVAGRIHHPHAGHCDDRGEQGIS
jgi:hypothetical protein